jgi:hypothetical protein
MPSASTYDEFSPLREVIVGDATGARIPRLDPSVWLTLFGELTAAELEGVRVGTLPRQVIEETNEDLEILSLTLADLGVVVHRVEPPDHEAEFGTPDWRSGGFYSYCPRDLTLIVGSAIIEPPSPMRARYFETSGLRSILMGYMEGGSPWIAAPKPRLLDDLYSVDADGLPILTEAEPAFEAANVLRCGRDLFYLVSCTGNERGLLWLENVVTSLGPYRVHPLRGIYRFMHIDSTIVVLRPGLVLLNPERVSAGTIPAPFRDWDVLWCPPMSESSTPAYPLGSAWIGMNLLMVNPELAIVDATQPDLIRMLEEHGIEVVPRTLRHGRLLGGGFHCVTLDTVRDGGPEDLFDGNVVPR